MKNVLFIALVALQFCALANASAAEPPPLQDLDAYVHKAMKQWQVPGLAVAVVKDGKVVLARGYGVRELGKPGKVDANTLFTIGSVTKQFTAAALGTLVSAGKLSWNARVVDHVKGFRLESPYVTEHITLLDLLTHRSGYCDPGAAWYSSDASDIIQRQRYQKPRFGFRADFCYDNVMYLTAARFIPDVTGESWNQYVERHLLAPLHMSRTVTTEKALLRSSDIAEPHGEIEGQVAVIRRYWAHNMAVFAPVGNINSSVNDMSHWLLMLLDKGRYAGKEILKPATIKAMETQHMLVGAKSLVGKDLRDLPGSDFYGYGLGLTVFDYGGHKLLFHPGDIDGMAAAEALVPDEHLGVVVLSNLDHNGARLGVLFHIIQNYLDIHPYDMSAFVYKVTQEEKKHRAAVEKKLAGTRKPDTKAPLPLKNYAGTYKDDLDGVAKVSLANGHLVLRLGNPNFTGDLEHWHGNTFRVTWRYRFYGKGYVTFDVDAFGKPEKLSFTLLPLHYERVGKTSHQ
jgi:CubicO group peptidase (beta-lactamase class C family)